MVNADHVIGALALTIISLAAAEVARPLRYLLVPVGAALLVTPFIHHADLVATVASIVCGVGLILLSLRRGGILQHYGGWQKLIV
jgi:hypothetical protein